MRPRTIILGLGFVFLMLAVVCGVLAALLPIGFTIGVAGAVEPARTVRVTAARSGMAVSVCEPGLVREGDILLKQSSGDEERRIAALEGEMAVVKKRLEHEREQIEATAKDRELQLALLTLQKDATAGTLASTRDVLAPLETKIRSRALEQQEIRRKLADAEYAILEELAVQQTVPRREVERGKADAAAALLKSRQLEVENKRDELLRSASVGSLDTDLNELELQAKKLSAAIPDHRAMLQFEERIETIRAQITELESEREKKTIRAPYDGRWLSVAAVENEYIAQGQLLGVLVDESRYRFVGSVRDTKFPWLKTGQQGTVRLRAFPYMKYGVLDATLVHTETRPGTAGSVFRVELELAENGPFTPADGMTGSADIVVFRGTFLQYLLARPGGDVTDAPPLPEWLERALRFAERKAGVFGPKATEEGQQAQQDTATTPGGGPEGSQAGKRRPSAAAE